MTVLVPITMFGFVFFSISLFFLLPPQKAVAVSVIGGFLLLPMYTYNFPIIQAYTKSITIAIGLLLGGLFSGNFSKYPLKLRIYDIPVLLWCFVSPFATSLSNSLGFYDGFSGMLQNYFSWGIFYLTGRRYFSSNSSLRVLTSAIIWGGCIYLPLVFFELRMSPKLSKIVYGFFPHEYIQHIRYGGYRPIVFMQHGLMVALWMAVSSTVLYWMWRTKRLEKMGQNLGGFITLTMMIATVLCKSANAWIFLMIGIVAFFYYNKTHSKNIFRLFLLFIPTYIVLRITNVISLNSIQVITGFFFDDKRVASLVARLIQEAQFGARALERALFGWGGYGRGWPINPQTGERMSMVVDSLWVILFSRYGALGLITVFLSLGIGPWYVLGSYKGSVKLLEKDQFEVDAIVLSLVVIFFMYDSLVNGMVNPAYILCAGALVSHYLNNKVILEQTSEIFQ